MVSKSDHLEQKERNVLSEVAHLRYGRFLAALVTVTTIVGCGGDGLSRVEIEGVVKAENGPVANAMVQFLPEEGTQGEGAIGQADAEGKFTVVSSRRRDRGIPPGRYRVRVLQMIDADGTVLPADALQAEYPMAREGVPAPYCTMESPLEVTIADDGGTIEIEIPAKTLGE